MAFNGTENFKPGELITFLETIGARFGPHVNAYTSFDETVYMLQLPTDSTRLVQQGFQVLEDWAHGVTYDTAEINKERGYVEPAAMAQVLQALVDKPEPMPEAPASKPAALVLLTPLTLDTAAADYAPAGA